MKKLRLLFQLTCWILFLSLFTACGSSEDEFGNKDEGSDNVTDVAVTGAVQDKSYYGVSLAGYVNLNLITSSYSSYQMGIEIAKNAEFRSSSKEYQVKSLTGNKMLVNIVNLDPETSYYYRTYVYVNSHYYYGETKTFTTNGIVNIASVSEVKDISFTDAEFVLSVDTNKLGPVTIKSNTSSYLNREIVLLCSEKKEWLNIDSLSAHSQYIYGWTKDYSYVKNGTCSISVYGLETNTTYYYCPATIVNNGIKMGSVGSFTTKDYRPYITTGEANNISAYSATIHCSTTLGEVLTETKYGVAYRKVADRYWATQTLDGLERDYKVSLEYLEPETTYEYSAFVSATGNYFGDIKTFTTPKTIECDFSDWESTNPSAGSVSRKEYTFDARKGMQLYFYCSMNSYCYKDDTKVTLKCPDGTEKILIDRKGYNSWSYTEYIESSGRHTLTIEFTKDKYCSYDKDCAGISDMSLR